MDLLTIATRVLRLEAKALEASAEKLTLTQLTKLQTLLNNLLETQSSLVITGVGKSGLIAQKIAATLCSLGLPSFFLHPVEAMHGDLGRVSREDSLLILSNSGSTDEVQKLLPYINIPIKRRIGILGNVKSPLAKDCHIVLDASVKTEACINNQAPTTSTTLALALGDMISVIFEHITDLSKESFAQFHPAGKLGKSLRMKVGTLMQSRSECPCLELTATLGEALIKMSERPLGGLAVIKSNGELNGIIVEGDIRRTLTSKNFGLESKLLDIMNPNPICINVDMLALEALKIMEGGQQSLNLLPITDSKNIFLGFLRLHDLLKEGL